MSHLFESGFCVRTPSWHRLETVLPEYPGSWDEARNLAGMAWDPISEPVYAIEGIDETGAPRYAEVDGFRRIARSDTGTTLSVMADTYSIIDHTEMGQIVEAVLEQNNVNWDTAGVLDEGRMVYACAYLDEPIEIPGDFSPTFPYLALLNRHDGRGACKVLPTTVRVVCANTFAAAEAEGERDGTAYSFNHTKNWRDRIADARNAVRGVRDAAAQWAQIATELSLTPVTKAQRLAFVADFIPMPPGNVISDRVVRNIDEARTAMFDLFESPTVAPIADTAYGLVQAAGEYLDHLRGYRNNETYMRRQLLKPQALKTKAITLAREVCAA